jgi:ribosome-associated protein
MAISAPRRAARSKSLLQLEELVLAALADMKAVNVRVMDVRGLTDVADTMIIASGNSDRHVSACADLVIERAKQAGRRPLGTEGRSDSEWVLVDLQDVLVHVMLPRVREFYSLEELWEAPAAARVADKPVKGSPAKAKAAKGKSRARSGNGTRSKASAKGSRAVTAPRAKRAARPRPSRPRG